MEEITDLSPDPHPLTLSSAPETSQNPRKKRTKFIRAAGENPKPANRKPDPSAPKITRPCTECGKTFWSWKALFGHMRCHPERQWRGINPPPNLRRQHIMQVTISSSSDPDNNTEEDSSSETEEDHEVAACLLMLANGPAASEQSPSHVKLRATPSEYSSEPEDLNVVDGYNSGGRFECCSCKKVFGSHQALGGHRASHKNVKGCYAITKNDEGEGCCSILTIKDSSTTSSSSGHKCSICFRVFPCGQALGGHMRCHWESKVEEASRICGLIDLNLAASHDDDGGASSSSAGTGLSLDLRLGL